MANRRKPDAQVIRDASGDPAYAVLPWNEYRNLMSAALTDEDLYDRAKARGEVPFPVAVWDRIDAGESPIRVFRDYRGTSASALAAQAGVSEDRLAALEAGRSVPTPAERRHLAEALGIPTDHLTDEETAAGA